MPELPEVETTARAIAKQLLHARFAAVTQRRPDLRFPLPLKLEEKLVGRTIAVIGRRAKYILIDLDDGQSLILHLGMSGRLIFDGPEQPPHEHLTFAFDNDLVLRFVDPRRFGMLDLVATEELVGHRWFQHLGVEPLANSFDGNSLLALIDSCRSPIKTAIMDQRKIVGVGNIYASESLYRARISPRRLASSVGRTRAWRLGEAIRWVLQHAIEAGGSSLRDYVHSDGQLGNFQNQFEVYGRDGLPCRRCGEPISRIVQTGRATYFCGHCQR